MKKKRKIPKLIEGGIVSKETAIRLGLERTHETLLTPKQLEEFTKEVLKETQKQWWEGKHNPIDDIKAMEKILKKQNLYFPLGKIKLTKEQVEVLMGDHEPISIGFKKDLTTESED